jgi:uncharacterized protein YggE
VKKRVRWTALLASALALGAPLVGQTANTPATIQAQGHGETRARADTVSVSISVDSAAPTGADAAQANATDVAKVTDAIKAKLGDRCTIVRANYMLNPQYDYSPPSQPTGFTADDQINVEFAKAMFTPEQAAKLTDTILSDFVRLQGSNDDDEGHTTLTYEVRSIAPTAAEAVRLNQTRTAKVLQAVRATFAERAKVETSSRLGAGSVPLTAPSAGIQRPVPPTHYAAHSELLVESGQIDLLPELLRIATSIGNARVNSATFLLRDRTAAQKEAIAEATREAESKAQSEGSALGVHLGPLLNSSVDLGPTVSMGGIGIGVTAGSGRAATIQPSDVSVYANVVLTYAVQ